MADAQAAPSGSGRRPTSGKGSRPERFGKKKKLLNLKEKGEILDKLEHGMGPTAVAKLYGVNESTIRSVRAKKGQIKQFLHAARGGTVASVAHVTTSKLMVTTEHYLKRFLDSKAEKNEAVSSRGARRKALEVYGAVTKKLKIGNPPKFVASVGWFQRFKKRHAMKTSNIHGEAASADVAAASNFPDHLKQIIEGGNYDVRQIFNTDESALHWKQQPRTTIIRKEWTARGHKPNKERFTVLFTVNSTGDCKMKPLVLYTAAKPRPYRHCDMNKINVFWMKNKKGWMTSVCFVKWFDEHFIPDAKAYCKRNGLPFKVVLTLDNAPGHPHFLQGRHPACEVVFLPANTTSVMQPLDQEIIANVKLSYHQKIMKQLELATDIPDIIKEIEQGVEDNSDEEAEAQAEGEAGDDTEADDAERAEQDNTRTKQTSKAMKFYKECNIKKGVDMMVECWKEISLKTVHHGWKNALPGRNLSAILSPDVRQGERQTVEAAMEAVVEAARAVRVPGYEELQSEDVRELISAEDINIEEMIEDEDLEEREEQQEEEQEEVGIGDMTTRQLTNIFTFFEHFKVMLNENDGDEFRRNKTIEDMLISMSGYTELLNKRINARKQALITSYMARNPPREPTPPAVSSDEEEEMVNMEQIAPVDLGHDFEGFALEDPRPEEEQQ